MHNQYIKPLLIASVFVSLNAAASLSINPSLNTLNSNLSKDHFWVQAALGPSFSKKSSTYIKVTDVETDKLAQTKNRTALVYSLGLGYTLPLQKSFVNQVNFSLDAYLNSSWHSKGYVYQFNMPEPNYDLKMNMRSNRLMLDGKVNMLRYHRFNPFLLVGIGHAWNILKSYKETAIPPTPEGYELNFSRHTTGHFAYQLGLGSDVTLTKNLEGFLEYLYTNSGYYTTGTEIDNQKVSVQEGGKFKAREHQVLVGLSYHFC